MRKKTLDVLVMVLAAVGILMSLAAARSGLAAGPLDQVAESGPAASARDTAPPVDAPTSEGQAQVDPSEEVLPEVGRSDATALAEATRQQRSPRPVRVSLDSVGIDAIVRPVGVQPDSQMRLPDNPSVLGWYRFGAAPGRGGATVLAGHLDSLRFGVGPLVRLRDVELGDTFDVALTNGTTEQYAVQRITRFDRQGLPDELFTRSGPELLHLITCGGAYDSDNGGYQQNLVVTAVPVG